MTTIVTADLHLSDNPRDAYRLAFLDKLSDIIKTTNARRLLILGDLTEEKDRHSAWLVNQIVDRIAVLAEMVDVVVLKGNHDYIAEDTPFLRFLKHLERVRWINKPTELNLRGLGSCLFLPHTNNWGDDNFNAYDWIFCHQTFEGSDVGHGHKMSGVSRSVFLRDAKVIAGDVHVPQTVGCVTYVGAPYHVDFGDSYDPRLLVLSGSKITTLPCRSPQKMLVTLTSGDADELLDASELIPGDIVKVRAPMTTEEAMSRSQFRAAVRERGDELGVDVHTVQIITEEKASVKEKKASAKKERSDEDLVRAYVKREGADKATITAGLKLMDQQ